MLTYQNNSDTAIAIVVFHEIYGINQHMTNVYEQLYKIGYDVICPNLLDRDEPYYYEQEESAYKNFVSIGFDRVAENARSILRQLRKKYKTLFVIGYSVEPLLHGYVVQKKDWLMPLLPTMDFV